mgnify:CR=1 FL=1
MRKLLNTLYVTSENSYLSLDGENVVISIDFDEKHRIPLHTLENIICFSYKGASPAIMGKCAKYSVVIFLSSRMVSGEYKLKHKWKCFSEKRAISNGG